MAYLPLPKETIYCSCGKLLCYKHSDGTISTFGTIKQDNSGTYIICPSCGRKIYLG